MCAALAACGGYVASSWAKEGHPQPLPATSKGRARLVRKPTARMTFATPRFVTQIDVWGSGRLRWLRDFELAPDLEDFGRRACTSSSLGSRGP